MYSLKRKNKQKLTDFQNLMKIDFCWRQNFDILLVHKPSYEIPHKIWARSMQPFWRLLDTNKQTDKTNLYIIDYWAISIVNIFSMYSLKTKAKKKFADFIKKNSSIYKI